MKKTLFLVILLIAGLSIQVYAKPAIGLITAGNMEGLSIKATEGNIRPQFIGSVLSNKNWTNFAVGLRGLYSLGNVGKVERYVGAGMGYGYTSNYSQQTKHNINGQAFIGIEFPLAYQQFVSPFTLSVEAILNAVTTTDFDVEIRSTVGVGIHYPF